MLSFKCPRCKGAVIKTARFVARGSDKLEKVVTHECIKCGHVWNGENVAPKKESERRF